MVAIGASAGGLEAFQKFFSLMPPDTGLAFVLIQHLDPRHETLIPELLSKHTSMPVEKIREETTVEANHIYVMPSHVRLEMNGCRLQPARLREHPQSRTPIDHFFRSLARDQGENSAGIILSGTGTDGTLGLQAIKEQGGLSLAQEMASTRFSGMPRHAIAAGLVDLVLPVEEMPARIIEYFRNRWRLQARPGGDPLRDELIQLLPRFFAKLMRRTSHDFSRYKQSTLLRRIQRRMQILSLDSPPDYLGRLRQDPAEVDQLFKDLLIGVTQFFRDPEAFEALARGVIPEIFKGKRPEDSVRVWVAGCATGEEAYSLAIMFYEHLATLPKPPRVQIFATDLDHHALGQARKACYPLGIEADVTPERLARFFVRHETGYELIEPIRELCVFSPHNLIKDPPFSRLDLVTCRNLLIYLEADMQKKLLPLFHYALNPRGFLFLGPSENIASRSELFQTLDQKFRVFQSKPTTLRTPLPLPGMESAHLTGITPVPLPQFPPTREQHTLRTIERLLIEEFAPPSVIINEEGEAIYFSGRTGRYLQQPAGAPSHKIVNMARRDLRLELRTAIQKAVTTRQPVIRPKLIVQTEGGWQPIRLVVRPLVELGRDAELLIVVFQELPPDVQAEQASAHPPAQPADLLVVQQMENELRSTKEDLQNTIEELETSNEELKSANEELLSMNEELQSTNEELHTSKEEIQSVNEELQKKIEELDLAHSDLQNLFQSTQIATIFLDRQLRLKNFTPTASELFPLTERHLGQPLLEIVPALNDGSFETELKDVLRTQTIRVKQFCLDNTLWYLMRLMPYRALDRAVVGAVLTFTEITDLKRIQEQRSQLAAIVESSDDAIIGKDLRGIITSWNLGAERIYGYSAAEVVGQPINKLVLPERQAELAAAYQTILRGEPLPPFETVRARKDGQQIEISLLASPIRDSEGRIIGVSAISRDITETKRTERALRESEERLRFTLDCASVGTWDWNIRTNEVNWSENLLAIHGLPPGQFGGTFQSFLEQVHPLDRPSVEQAVQQAVGSGGDYHVEYRLALTDQAERWVEGKGRVLRDETGQPVRMAGVCMDVTPRKQAEEALRVAREELQRHAQTLEAAVAERTAELEETIKSLDSFCYSIAHDLRAPLRGVQGFTSALLEDYGAAFDETGLAYARRIVSATSHMDQLIQDLLAYGRISHEELVCSALELDPIVAHVLTQLSEEIKSRRAEIDIARPLPRVLGHPAVLEQIVLNFFTNALKFVAAGVTPKLKVWSETGHSHARLFFQDNGIGIKKEHQERIFQVFERLHGVEAYPGTGIGLAIVKKGIERMGGHVGLNSETRRGSTFWIELRCPAPSVGRETLSVER